MKYCSQCKFSKYVERDGVKKLRCDKAKEYDLEEHLPVSCLTANACPLFEPERAEKKTFPAWLQDMKRCGITLRSYLKEIF